MAKAANAQNKTANGAPIGITKGSTITSDAGTPKSEARSTMRFATANRTSGSIEMPVSSLEIATTAAPYLATSGMTRSSRKSNPRAVRAEHLSPQPPAGLKRPYDPSITMSK